MRGIGAVTLSLALATAAPAAAQGVAQFTQLWQEFLAFCGPAVIAPPTIETEKRRFAGYEMATWSTAVNGRVFNENHIDEPGQRYLGIQSLDFGTQRAIECSAHYSDLNGAIPADSLGPQIVAMLNANPVMDANGGGTIFDPTSDSYAEMQASETDFMITVSNVFGGFPDALTIASISPWGLTLSVYHVTGVTE